MKKLPLFILALSICALSKAQTTTGTQVLVFDESEDSTQVMTIAEIVQTQEAVASRNTTVAHFDKVWSYSSYFDLAYNTKATLSPKDPIKTGVDSYENGFVPTFNSDFGASLVLGHNYGLHKPIAGIAKFNIDFKYIDLSVNHYKVENDGNKIYDAEATINGNNYFPWNMEKYEISYGMAIGPSLTVAPFTMLRQRSLHFIKFNVFYHIGYQGAVLLAMNDEDHYVTKPKDDVEQLSLKLGHGMTTSLGFRLSWKTIGIGYEMKNGKLNFVSLEKQKYGGEHYKFNTMTNRVFLEIRY